MFIIMFSNSKELFNHSIVGVAINIKTFKHKIIFKMIIYHQDPVPKFHYETRAFSRVVSNTDLTDNDLELRFVNQF